MSYNEYTYPQEHMMPNNGLFENGRGNGDYREAVYQQPDPYRQPANFNQQQPNPQMNQESMNALYESSRNMRKEKKGLFGKKKKTGTPTYGGGGTMNGAGMQGNPMGNPNMTPNMMNRQGNNQMRQPSMPGNGINMNPRPRPIAPNNQRPMNGGGAPQRGTMPPNTGQMNQNQMGQSPNWRQNNIPEPINNMYPDMQQRSSQQMPNAYRNSQQPLNDGRLQMGQGQMSQEPTNSGTNSPRNRATEPSPYSEIEQLVPKQNQNMQMQTKPTQSVSRPYSEMEQLVPSENMQVQPKPTQSQTSNKSMQKKKAKSMDDSPKDDYANTKSISLNCSIETEAILVFELLKDMNRSGDGNINTRPLQARRQLIEMEKLGYNLDRLRASLKR